MIQKHTAKEELIDELDHYLRFDTAPISEQEQEEVLLNPLLWWKLSIPFIFYGSPRY